MVAPLVLGYRTYPCLTAGATLQNPVVLVRGLGRSSGFWLEFIDALTPWAKVVTVDLRGTGLSPSKTGLGSIEALAADLAHTLQAEGLLPCHLVGISLGGMVCVEAAARLVASTPVTSAGKSDGEVVSLSVLASSARFTRQRRLHPRAALDLIFALRKKIPRNREFARWLVSSAALKARPDLPEKWDEIWRKEGFEKLAVVRQLLAAALFDGRRALDALSAPACFIVSRDDGLVNWRNSVGLWDRVPGSRLHVLSGPGHDFPTERPEETAELLKVFFEQCEAHG